MLELDDTGAILSTTNLGNTPDNDAFGLVATRDGDLFLHEGSGEVFSVDISSGTAVFTEIDPVDPVPRKGNARIFGSAGFGICFAKDVLIETSAKHIPIQDLTPGDRVRTKGHGLRTLRWIGSCSVRATGKFAPVVFQAGAIGNQRELVLSQLHQVLVSGWRAEILFGEAEVLSEAKALINGDTIYLREGGEIEYSRLLFDRHEIIFAEGVETESLFLGDSALGALSTSQLDEVLSLFPELTSSTSEKMLLARPVIRQTEAKIWSKKRQIAQTLLMADTILCCFASVSIYPKFLLTK